MGGAIFSCFCNSHFRRRSHCVKRKRKPDKSLTVADLSTPVICQAKKPNCNYDQTCLLLYYKNTEKMAHFKIVVKAILFKCSNLENEISS